MRVSMARLVALTIDGVFFQFWQLNFRALTVDAVKGGNLVQELGPVYMKAG